MAAAGEPGKVEGTDNVLADGTLGKPLYEGMPAFSKGLVVDAVECVPDVVATSQHTAQDEGGRDGLVVLAKDVSPPGMWGRLRYLMCVSIILTH